MTVPKNALYYLLFDLKEWESQIRKILLPNVTYVFSQFYTGAFKDLDAPLDSFFIGIELHVYTELGSLIIDISRDDTFTTINSHLVKIVEPLQNIDSLIRDLQKLITKYNLLVMQREAIWI